MAGVLSTAAPAAAAVQIPFSANSGDACLYGSTRGTVTVQTELPSRPVQVVGSLTDKPAGPGVPETCPDDRRSSTVTVIGFRGGKAVGGDVVRADNATVAYRIPFNQYPPIDRITIRVCRAAAGTPVYCGVTREIPMPITPAN